MMSGIRGKNTKPEQLLRKALHRRGFRFRLHDKSLPGRPDIVFPRRHAVVMVHGCFWHAHAGCKYFKVPDSRREFWTAKLDETRARDTRDPAALRSLGWRVAVVWECATRVSLDATIEAVDAWLRSDEATLEVSVP
ncbi:very short patch repair endonuclease [Nocardioides sp. B-3]|uniref:very short patch repair endonuclease n=1 Tax=Nocardioides sp. B-3 TaxID=2895565 RepID=UPI003FA5A57D